MVSTGMVPGGPERRYIIETKVLVPSINSLPKHKLTQARQTVTLFASQTLQCHFGLYCSMMLWLKVPSNGPIRFEYIGQ